MITTQLFQPPGIAFFSQQFGPLDIGGVGHRLHGFERIAAVDREEVALRSSGEEATSAKNDGKVAVAEAARKEARLTEKASSRRQKSERHGRR